MIIIKTDNELKIMRQANRIIAIVLSEIRDRVKPGVSTLELDQWAEERLLSFDSKPGFKGYISGNRMFPATLCMPQANTFFVSFQLISFSHHNHWLKPPPDLSQCVPPCASGTYPRNQLVGTYPRNQLLGPSPVISLCWKS